jgi:hypothetical protein
MLRTYVSVILLQVLLDAPGTLVVDCMEHAQVDKEDRVVVLVAPLQSSACSGNAVTADHHFKRLLQDAQHSTIVVVNSVSCCSAMHQTSI